MAALNGMDEISEYYGYSAPTVLALIRNRSFPAVKPSGGNWVSDTELIDQWRREQILRGCGKRSWNMTGNRVQRGR
jgi:predicted DNA-binding transcriptional regulator AlpA